MFEQHSSLGLAEICNVSVGHWIKRLMELTFGKGLNGINFLNCRLLNKNE